MRTAKHDETFDVNGRSVRVRVYATRREYEALIGEGSIDDPAAEVWCYPKVGDAATWAHQAALDSERTRGQGGSGG